MNAVRRLPVVMTLGDYFFQRVFSTGRVRFNLLSRRTDSVTIFLYFKFYNFSTMYGSGMGEAGDENGGGDNRRGGGGGSVCSRRRCSGAGEAGGGNGGGGGCGQGGQEGGGGQGGGGGGENGGGGGGHGGGGGRQDGSGSGNGGQGGGGGRNGFSLNEFISVQDIHTSIVLHVIIHHLCQEVMW